MIGQYTLLFLATVGLQMVGTAFAMLGNVLAPKSPVMRLFVENMFLQYLIAQRSVRKKQPAMPFHSGNRQHNLTLFYFNVNITNISDIFPSAALALVTTAFCQIGQSVSL